jgi:hypothetical protein
MIEYSWTFSNCKVIQKMGDLDNVIKTVDWTLTASDGNQSVNAQGTTEFGETDPIQFVPFTELTKDMMIEWVLSGISAEELQSVKEYLEKQIAELNKPVLVQMNLPFN